LSYEKRHHPQAFFSILEFCPPFIFYIYIKKKKNINYDVLSKTADDVSSKATNDAPFTHLEFGDRRISEKSRYKYFISKVYF
jgi:hypothetical protein